MIETTEKPKTPITEDQFEQICNELELTDNGLANICRSEGISERSFYQYIKVIGELAEQRYARAKAIQIEHVSDDIKRLDEECIGVAKSENYDPKSKNAIVQAYKLKSDNLKWLLSKLIPKKYGDKLDITTDNESINRSIEITPISLTKGSVDKT